MNQMMRSLGAIIVMIGVLVLFIHFVGNIASNVPLIIAGLLFVGGIGAHIFLNKHFTE